MFYASTSPDANYKEIKHDIKEGEEVYLSHWQIKEGCSLDVYPICLPEHINQNADASNCIAITSPYFTEGEIGKYLRELSKLFMEIETDEDKWYLSSSFLANYILKQNGSINDPNGNTIKINYDAVLYPSVRNKNGFNIAIKPEVIDEKAELIYVIKGKLKDDLSSISFDQIGFCENEMIEWYELEMLPENTDIIYTSIRDENNNKYGINDCIIKGSKGKPITNLDINWWINQDYKKEMILAGICKNNLTHFTCDYGKINNKESLLQNFELYACCTTEGWTIETDKGSKKASLIEFDVICKNSFRKI